MSVSCYSFIAFFKFCNFCFWCIVHLSNCNIVTTALDRWKEKSSRDTVWPQTAKKRLNNRWSWEQMHFYLKLLKVMVFWLSFLADKICLTEMIRWVRVVFFGVSYHAIPSCSLLNVLLKLPIAKMTLSKCISSCVMCNV